MLKVTIEIVVWTLHTSDNNLESMFLQNIWKRSAGYVLIFSFKYFLTH